MNQFIPLFRRGRLAEYVEAVADLKILDIAEIGVEPGESFVFGCSWRDAAFSEEAFGGREVKDGAAQRLRAAAVEAVGGGVLVNQAFEFGGVPVQAGGTERGREVADGDGAESALRRSGLAGVADDEGVDHG